MLNPCLTPATRKRWRTCILNVVNRKEALPQNVKMFKRFKECIALLNVHTKCAQRLGRRKRMKTLEATGGEITKTHPLQRSEAALLI